MNYILSNGLEACPG